MALTKDKIVDELVSKHSLVRREAVDFVDTFFDDIKHKVQKGERVTLMGFGTMLKGTSYYIHKRRTIEYDEDAESRSNIKIKPSTILKGRIQRALIEEAKDVD